MSYPNLLENYAAAVQAEMRKSVIQNKQQVAPTKGSLKSGTGARGAAGRLAGLEIPFYRGVPHGETALDPLAGTTSFGRFVAPLIGKMYVGLAQMGFTVEWEHFHEVDAGRGALPETRFSQRDKAMLTYMQHQNWYSIGKGDGALAIAAAGGPFTTSLTLANDATARGRSKGSLRLAVSPGTTAGKRILYDAVDPSTGTVRSTFYVTAKASATTATIVYTSGSAVNSSDVICKSGHYLKVPYGLGYHGDDDVTRMYQGTSMVDDPQLAARGVDGGAALINPSVLDTAKGAQQTRANNANARKNRVCHLTVGNYKTLSGFGYTLRTYNAEKGEADTTFGLPFVYEDEDTVFIQDADMEDAYIYMRDRKSLFEYRQTELEKISKGDGTQYIGTNSFGSTEFFDNYGESFNMAWDSRGDDGKGGQAAPNSMIVIDNLQIPANNQVTEGLTLV